MFITRFRQLALWCLLLAVGFCLIDGSLVGQASARSKASNTSIRKLSKTSTASVGSITQVSSVSVSSSTTTPMVHAVVDFSVSTPKKNLSGFLHGIGATSPADSLITPLKPAWWRISADDITTYNHAVKLGAQPIVVISDAYGYPQENWKGNGAPWQNNWTNWEAKVRQLAQQYRNIPVYWDIWNEPDVWGVPNTNPFWSGTQAQYFETYKRAYTILRQELGSSAIIGGPSYGNYDQSSLAAFLNYCSQNNLQINYLSWHELNEVEFNTAAIPSHLAYMRALAASYPNLKIQKVLINEMVGLKTQYMPGDILGFLYYLEKAGADGANKTCWDDSKGVNNCFNNSVDGILNVSGTSITPRASWWAYKTYADGLSSRVNTTSDNANVVLMASKTPGQVILGYVGNNSSPTNVSLNLRNLGFIGQKGTSVKVNISKIPNSGENALASMVPISSKTVPVNSGSATISITGINPHEEYVVYLTP